MDGTFDFEQLQVLVVDGNEHMRSVVTAILQGFGIKSVITVADAAAGFERLKTSTCDLVICEYQLQPVDGLEFVKMVRTAPDTTNPLIPILMLTAHTELPRVTAARDAGISGFVTKPVSPANLYKHLVAAIERPRQFVRSQGFFGPDRRRKRDGDFKGSDRRGKRAQTDPADTVLSGADECDTE